MTPTDNQPPTEAMAETAVSPTANRRRLLALLTALLLLFAAILGLFIRYINRPAPLPELLIPESELVYPPHYLFSIYGLDQPVGVTLSPDGTRIYAAESGGDRLVRIFNRAGDEIDAFAPPRTRPGERAPIYLAMDSAEHLYVTDRLQHAVFVYDRDGRYLDALIAPDLSISEYVAQHMGGLQPNMTITYNNFYSNIYVQIPGSNEQTLPTPVFADPWSPLGIRINAQDKAFITDAKTQTNQVHEFSLPDGNDLIDWHQVNATAVPFGATGEANGELLYPNSAVADSRGRIFVSDGNNGRISVWDAQGNFLFNFGGGNGEESVSLPRGMAINGRDHLYVVDAVGQNIKVYDVSADEPTFLYTFGDWGLDDGLFNYPNDIAIDDSGRIYIADRENHRIQVWSY